MDKFKKEENTREFFKLIISVIKEEQLQLIDEGWIDVEGYVYYTDSGKDIFLTRDGQSLYFNLSQMGLVSIKLFEQVNGEIEYNIEMRGNENLCKKLIKILVQTYFSGRWHSFVFSIKGRDLDEWINN